ncbi:hypothetical protein FHS16_003611 [Paenibacillus endophyticus]|uniref:Transposase DDE domain-containing protein n=1 Tax=Paenibacillus endophyticus TaxID=1294268 RepID=A0A7W5GAS0_9BACL|nr:transposase [Paenibacillus endophyticus]MBB3153549.1 hypothetical protein [Paenibacillus endophyticus]
MSAQRCMYKSKGKSRIQRESEVSALQTAREKLRSEDGYALLDRRTIEPERVFGQMKNNRGFRRFLLRGLPKVSLEVGWLSLAHNLLKKAAIDQKAKMAVQG